MTILNYSGEDITKEIVSELAGVLSRITKVLCWPESVTEEDKLALRIDYVRLQEIQKGNF